MDPVVATITLNVKAINQLGLWEAVSALKGINPWAQNEGQISNYEMIELTIPEARSVGLISDRRSGW